MMRVWLQSRRLAVIFGMLVPSILLVVYHRMALVLPWHFVLFSVLVSASSMLWSLTATSSDARVLRFLVLPGLSFAVLFTLLVSLMSVPLAFFSLVSFGHRLVSYFDLRGAFSLLLLACCGVAPAASLLAFLGQLSSHLEVFKWHGWGSRVALSSVAVVMIVACFFASSFTETKMQSLMLEKPWRPNGVLHRLFQFDAICEVSCRDMFVQAFNAKRETDLGYLEQNFQLLFNEDLNVVWQNERFSVFGFQNARASKP
jgi:hypothetical protein